jgi:hypothetical protein
MLSPVITIDKLFPCNHAGFQSCPSVSVKEGAPKAQIEALRARFFEGERGPAGEGEGGGAGRCEHATKRVGNEGRGRGISGDDRLQRGNYPRITEGGINRRGSEIPASPKREPSASARHSPACPRARWSLVPAGHWRASLCGVVCIWNPYQGGKRIPPRWGDFGGVPAEPMRGFAAGRGNGA